MMTVFSVPLFLSFRIIFHRCNIFIIYLPQFLPAGSVNKKKWVTCANLVVKFSKIWDFYYTL